MRYADGPTAEVTALIEAPIETIWSLVTDIDLPARFSTEFRGATWLDDGPRVAARFVGRNYHAALGEWETTCYVTRLDPPRAYAWAVSDPRHPAATWWYELDQQPDGVLVRFGARVGPAPSGLTIAITAMPDKEEGIIARRLQEFTLNMTATLQGIKELAEASR